jgi:hypothetical protein
MIASALRAEIERSASAVRARNPLVSAAMVGATRPAVATLPSLSPLLDRLDGGPADDAAGLAVRAFFQYVAAENGVAWIRMLQERCGIPRDAFAFLGRGQDECRDRVEEALDAIDVLVDDPTQLPVLREQLREVIGHFDRLCEEIAHGAGLGDVHVSAA